MHKSLAGTVSHSPMSQQPAIVTTMTHQGLLIDVRTNGREVLQCDSKQLVVKWAIVWQGTIDEEGNNLYRNDI